MATTALFMLRVVLLTSSTIRHAATGLGLQKSLAATKKTFPPVAQVHNMDLDIRGKFPKLGTGLLDRVKVTTCNATWMQVE